VTAPGSDSIVFTDADRPSLSAGTHEISVAQDVTVDGVVRESFTAKARLHVVGARTALPASWIESRFPPPEDGQDADVLPHVVLTRSSLPWERSALDGATAPWLTVLLLTAGEMADVREGRATPAELATATASPSFPGLSHEKGDDDAQIRVLDVPRTLLAGVAPKASWLDALAHVRERYLDTVTVSGATDPVVAALDRRELHADLAALLLARGVADPGPVQVEVPGVEWRIGATDPVHVERSGQELTVTRQARAVVLGCRPTVPDTRYHAFLVSLERRYVARVEDVGEPHDGERFRIDWHGAALADPVRLVVLDSWEFAVGGTSRNLSALLGGLDHAHGPTIPTDGFLGTGIGPVLAGWTLLPHHLGGTGGAVHTWYRGPLVATRMEDAPEIAAETADDLLMIDPRTGILFGAHAAAFELGRTLTLAETAVALDLARWRTDYRRYDHRRRTAAAASHLDAPELREPTLPGSVTGWWRRLVLLDGVPFGYLIPDPAMLPTESVRTFVLDPGWMAALLRGAQSIGRMPGSARATAPELPPLGRALDRVVNELMADGEFRISGLLLRSAVVAGWPELRIDGFAADGGHCAVLRRAALSPNVLLVLFRGDPAEVHLHPDPEALHHGLVPGGGLTITLDGKLLDIGRTRTTAAGNVLPSNEFAWALRAGVPRLRLAVPLVEPDPT
jgi:hypothetical protein